MFAMSKQLCFAQKAFILNEGKVLLVRKSLKDPDQPGRWEVPGGRMQFGEGVDEQLKREVREEVGLEIVPGDPFHIWEWRIRREGATGVIMEMQIVAVARVCQPLTFCVSTSGQMPDDYLDAAVWVPVGELDRYDFIPNMVPAVRSFLHYVNAKRGLAAAS